MTESESSTISGSPAMPGARWALALGGVLLAGFLIIIVCGLIDRGQRGNLETVSQATAVEDKTYYSIPPDDAGTPPVAVRLGDRALRLVSPDIVALRDADARRVAIDPATGLAIYETEYLKVISASERGNSYLLKVEAGKYVKVQAAFEKDSK